MDLGITAKRNMFSKEYGEFRKITGLATGNIYVIPERDERVILVDCGGPLDFILIDTCLKSLSFKRGGELHLVLTHFHFDHAGSAARMKRLYNAKIWAHEHEVPILEGKEKVPVLYRKGLIGTVLLSIPFKPKGMGFSEPIVVDHAFKDGDILPLLGGLEVIHTPGHTPGSSSFFWKEKTVLFSGDAIINTFRFLTLPTEGFSCDFELTRESALKLAEFAHERGIRALCTGHGPVIEKPSIQISRFRKRVL